MTALSVNVTLAQVAKLAGVSGMTVSRVLRDSARVSATTRERVLAAVAELGYVPNRLAGALATSSTPLVVVVLPSLANIVFPEVLRGITERLDAAGLQAVVGFSDYDLDKEERLIDGMLSWRPSGLVVAGLEHTARARRLLADAHIPVVEIMDIDGEPIDMAVGLSNRAAGGCMAGHLVAAGRRRIGYVGGDLAKDLRAGKRHAGFVQALAGHGLALEAEFTAGEPSSLLLGRSGLAALLAAHPALDAVYFSNDDMAVGGLMHCIAAGIDVPGRLALAGFNGLEIGQATPLRLTTVHSPRLRIGQQAAARILERRQGAAPPRVTDVGFELVAGQTA